MLTFFTPLMMTMAGAILTQGMCAYILTVMDRDPDARLYRSQADRIRQEAEKAVSPVVRGQLLEIADQLERLADNIEAASSRTAPEK